MVNAKKYIWLFSRVGFGGAVAITRSVSVFKNEQTYNLHGILFLLFRVAV